MDLSDDHITVKLQGQATGESRVPVRLLTRTLDGFQATANQLGNYRFSRDPKAAGRSPSIVERDCELFVVGIQLGSLTADLTVPLPEQTYFEEMAPLGQQVLEDLRGITASVQDDDPDLLESIVPDPKHRARVLKSFLPVLPTERSDYQLLVRAGRARPLKTLQRPDETKRLARAIPQDVFRPSKSSEKLVQGTCRCVLRDGKPARVLSWVDYEILDNEELRPYRTTEVRWNGHVFVLEREIACSLTTEQGNVILEYPELGVRVHGRTRDEAIAAFAQEFSFLWHEYALAPDESLWEDAKGTKRRLLALVQEAKPE